MTSEEIRAAIDEIIDQMTIDFNASMGKFVLNNNMIHYQNQITALQNQCHHKFEDGQCIYCYMMEVRDD